MHRKIKDRRVVIEDPLRTVAVMDIPVENSNSLDFLMLFLRIARCHRDIIEKAEPHGAIRGCMMTGRPHRHEGIVCDALEQRIDRATGGAGAAQSSFQRSAGNKCVRIEVATPFAHSFLDVFKVLRGVASLDVAAPGFAGFKLYYSGPQFGIAPQCFDGDAVALGPLRMVWPGIVPLKNRVMNYGGGHLVPQGFNGLLSRLKIDWSASVSLAMSAKREPK
jgi:hypothetical protein